MTALLEGVKEAAYATTASKQQRSVQALCWFLNEALPSGAVTKLLLHPGLISGLLRLPNCPYWLAASLCTRGLRVAYDDIAAAASGTDRVAGAAPPCSLRRLQQECLWPA